MNSYTNPIYDYIYFDIETCGKSKDWETFKKEYPEGVGAFEKKYNSSDSKYSIDEYYLHFTPVTAEFNRVVCISIGILSNNGGKMSYNIQSFHGENEKEIIEKFNDFLNTTDKYAFCGYSIKGFDIPVIQKKFIRYGIKLPHQLKTLGKKPWEVTHFDLAEAWKGMGYLSSSFDAACFEMGIESPKDDIYGGEVHKTFYDPMQQNALERIKDYCEKDVLASIKMCIKIIKVNL